MDFPCNLSSSLSAYHTPRETTFNRPGCSTLHQAIRSTWPGGKGLGHSWTHVHPLSDVPGWHQTGMHSQCHRGWSFTLPAHHIKTFRCSQHPSSPQPQASAMPVHLTFPKRCFNHKGRWTWLWSSCLLLEPPWTYAEECWCRTLTLSCSNTRPRPPPEHMPLSSPMGTVCLILNMRHWWRRGVLAKPL